MSEALKRTEPQPPATLSASTPPNTPSCDLSTIDEQGKTPLGFRASDTTIIPATRLGDYELQREIARGGMGVVFEARQVSLNRTVAVKMILHGQFADAEDIGRFHVEAQAAAQLQHPNIVSIHEVGQSDGCHYFSMEYVDGVSLQAMVRNTPPKPAQAARYLKTIADAIHYAHERGILHRDLKPSNVLIDGSGTPRVTDFGLAKRMEAGAELTGTGQILGTPSYMPPEQAAGKWADVCPASDVYALGAMLYDMLTGRPPFRAETPLETLRQVIELDPVPPRLLNAAVDRDLETICLKCLHKEPNRRYASARELSEDLDRYLSGTPILARRSPLWERTMKLAKRRPAAASLVVTLAAVVVAMLVTAILYNHQLQVHNQELKTLSDNERRQAEEARKRRDEAERERIASDRNFRRARDTVDTFFTEVSEEQLLNEPGMQPLRHKLLKRALDYYEEFVRERAGDPTLQDQFALAYFRVGLITKELGSLSDAVDACRTATRMFEEIVAADPGNEPILGDLARAHNNLALMLKDSGDFEAASKSLQRSREIREGLARARPDNVNRQANVAKIYKNTASLFYDTGKRDDARELLEQSLAILERVVAGGPVSADVQALQASCFADIGRLRKDDNDALRDFRHAIELYEALAAQYPRQLTFRQTLATCHEMMAGRFRDTVPSESLKAYRRSIEIREELCQANPEMLEFRAELGTSYDQLAWVRFQARDKAEALSLFERARDSYGTLVAASPSNIKYQRFFAGTHNGVGLAQRDLNQPNESMESFQAALAIQEKVAADNPDYAENLNDLAGTHNNIGRLHMVCNRHEAAIESYQRAAEILDGMLRANPKYVSARRFLGDVWANLADAQGRTNNPSAVAESLQRALETFETLVRDQPGSLLFQNGLGNSLIDLSNFFLETADYDRSLEFSQQAQACFEKLSQEKPQSTVFRNGLGGACLNRGVALQKMGQLEEARSSFEYAVEQFRFAFALAPNATRESLNQGYQNLARIFRDLRKPTEAVATALERKKLWPRNGNELYLVACELALCVPLVEPDPPDLRQRHADQALDVLREAVAAGFKDLNQLQQDSNLDPIRTSGGFEQLVEQLKTAQ
jgi:serine/threonine protein kinase